MLASEAAFLAAGRRTMRANVEKLPPNGVDKPLRAVHPAAVNSILLNIGDIHVPDVVAHDPMEVARARARAAFWLTLIFWGVSFGLATLTIYLDGKPQWLAMSLMRIPPAL